jgi:hypothetical protein
LGAAEGRGVLLLVEVRQQQRLDVRVTLQDT